MDIRKALCWFHVNSCPACSRDQRLPSKFDGSSDGRLLQTNECTEVPNLYLFPIEP